MAHWLSIRRLLPTEQHGFSEGASTTTQLLDCTFDWLVALNNNFSVDIVYFDLSKAFDKVNHSKLIQKLNQIGMSDIIVRWIASYLADRNMWVKVGDAFSQRYSCPSGVPQGGVLSPLLFLIYCLDLPSKLKTHTSIKVQLYADDIKLYGIYNSENRLEVSSALADSIRRMMEWSADWDLPVNLTKTFVVHLGNCPIVQYQYNDICFENRNEIKDLGVIINTSLDFSTHINQAVKKAYRSLFFIFRNVSCKDPGVLLRLYKAYVLPHLEYCCQVWSPSRKCLQSKIENVQRTFTRLLFHRTMRYTDYLNPLPDYSRRLQIFGLKSLLYRRIFHDLVLCFRILHLQVKLKASKYWFSDLLQDAQVSFIFIISSQKGTNFSKFITPFSCELLGGCKSYLPIFSNLPMFTLFEVS